MKKGILAVVLVALVGLSAYSINNYNKANTEKPSNKTLSSTKENSSKETSSNNSEINNNASSEATANNANSALEGKLNPSVVKVKAQDFKLKDLSGKEISLSSFKGENVLLNFWATWCPPCKSEMPDMEKLYQETKDSDLVILAVNIGEDRDTVKEFIDNNKYNYRILLDSDTSVSEKYTITSIPTTYLIDKEGNIVPFVNKQGKTVNKNLGAMTLEEMKAYLKYLK
jgi:peroxiredoxin